MIGPTLPPHLRKDKEENQTDVVKEIKTTLPPSKPAEIGPQLSESLRWVSSEGSRKRKREVEGIQDDENVMLGPTLPLKRNLKSPAPTEEDSESEPEVGPSLSVMMTPNEAAEHTRQQAIERLSRTSLPPKPATTVEPKVQRDAWMLAPPTKADWQNSLDASKFKPRSFNQSKTAANLQQNASDHRIWTETPQERAQRIEDEALGKVPKSSAAQGEDTAKKAEAAERHRLIKAYNEKTRGLSLMEMHNANKNAEEDDPNKRPFDYQKDIAGQRMGLKERNAMFSRAQNLDTKYAGGNYL